MNRVAFTLHVRPEMLGEYRARHRAVWPEMLEALSEAGWHNYSLFVREDGLLFGYLETPGTLDEARAKMADKEVNARWQTLMQPFFVSPEGAKADELMLELEPVFFLP